MAIKTINNETLEYQDAVFHSVNNVTFSFIDRIKFLFGFKFSIDTTIYTLNEKIDVVYTETTISIPNLFPSKDIGGCLCIAESV